MVCMLLCPMVGAEAAYSGTVKYGGFEESGTQGVEPRGWTVFSSSPWYGQFVTTADFAAEGRFSLKTVSSGSGTPQARISGALYWGYFDISATYELSVKVLVPSGSSIKEGLLRAVLRDEAGKTSDLFTPGSKRISGDTGGAWKTIRLTFTPKRSFGALDTVYIRCNGGASGTAYWDDLQLHKLNADGSYADVTPETVYDESTNILENGDFSGLKNGDTAAADWESSGTWGKTSIVQKNADGDKTAILLSGTGNPYITQTAEAAGGTKLTLSVRYKTDGDTGTPVIKFVFRDGNGSSMREFSTETLPPTYGKWKQFTYDVTVEDGAKGISVLLRKYGDANVYYSTARLYVSGGVPLLTIGTDNNETFYYRDWKNGTASITLNTDPVGKTVVFYIKDGETRVQRKTMAAAKTLSFDFSLQTLSVKSPCVLTVELTNGSEILDTAEKTVYIYERPEALGADGCFAREGERIRPLIGYHVYAEDLPAAKAAGINVVQGMGDYETESIGTFLDTCWYTYGIRVLVPLYSGNMLPAGHYVNRERTEAIISAYKDHPGVFGWMVQDEPFLHNRNNPEEVKSQLADSYKLIRELDDVHPVYITADIYSAEYYRDIGNACDIIAPDDYALGSGRALTSVYGNMKAVNEAVRGRKPVYALLQTFAYDGGVQPTMDELGHMIYQSLLAGADAIGFYSFRETGWNFAETPLYNDLAVFNEKELPALYTQLENEEYTETVSETYLTRIYEDNVQIAINLSDSPVQLPTVFPDDFAVHFGNAVLSEGTGGLKVTLPHGGRMLGNTKLPAFGNTLRISGDREKTVRFTADGKKLIPTDAVLCTAVYENYNAAWEMTDFAVGKTEAAVTVPAGKAWKMAVMLMCLSDGRPIYIKEVITSQQN